MQNGIYVKKIKVCGIKIEIYVKQKSEKGLLAGPQLFPYHSFNRSTVSQPQYYYSPPSYMQTSAGLRDGGLLHSGLLPELLDHPATQADRPKDQHHWPF